MTGVILWISLIVAPSWLNLTGRHFNIYYHGPDKAVARDVERRLEENYFRFTNIFDVDFDRRIEVYIHPDLHSLKNNMNINDESQWLVGLAVGDRTIHIVSPANPPGNHSYESVMEGLLHEFVHICVARASSRPLPVWLNEGLAVYYSGQHRFTQEVPGIIKDDNNLPTFFSLSDQARFAQRRGYPLSYTIIEVAEKYAGEAAISRLVREYPDLSALGMTSLNELEEMWHRHLYYKYKNPPPLEGWSEFGDNYFEVSLEPNPVRDQGELRFVTPSSGLFTINVLDPWGNIMQNLFEQRIEAGMHRMKIDARSFLPGIYYLEMNSGGQRQLVRFSH